MLSAYIKPFLQQHSLPESYIRVIEKWFIPLAEELILHQKEADRPIVIGINGSQGSGKTTLADLMVFLATHHYQLNAVSLSLDDFYLTLAERTQLAQAIHPLFQIRGVPGTHDITLAVSTIKGLIEGTPLVVPRFNKAIDDRRDPSQWDEYTEPVKFIILEGWCLGARAQTHEQLERPVNELEEKEDPESLWRNYINQQLIHQYPKLFNLVDQWVMLKAPSFDCVYHWRLEQEHKLKQKALADMSMVMTDEEVKRFISFYQRLTEHIIGTLPSQVNYLFELNEQRKIINASHPRSTERRLKTKQALMIFTDMDGTLLNHHDYNFEAAKPTLTLLQNRLIPVIPTTSKTAAELIALRRTLDNHSPFIIENGAAVYIPVGSLIQQPVDTIKQGQFWIKSFTEPRAHWVDLLEQVKNIYGPYFRQFSEMSAEEIAEITGLQIDEAENASKRAFGEPVLWQGTEALKQQFIADLQRLGAVILEGGRFIHVSGSTDKAKAMNWLTDVYRQDSKEDKQFITLAIGDSNNDIAMLEAADIALLIPSPVNSLPELKRQDHIYISEHIAPLGWKQGVEQILQELEGSEEETHG